MAPVDRKLGGTLVVAIGAVLCCAFPLLLAIGAMGLWAGWLARSWPVVIVGALLVVYGIRIWYRSSSRSGRSEKR
ncbi:MAG: hypothetical protein KY393_05845 [Actinobacteria bacterium]|nr:hypothetical protein [Actinomycetota bacterium]